MSEVYREETCDESRSDEGSCYDHDVGIETDDFVWEDALDINGEAPLRQNTH